MMCKKQNKGVALMRTLAIVPSMIGAMALVNIPAVASAIDFRAADSGETIGEVTKNPVDRQVQNPVPVLMHSEKAATEADVQPSFPGGEDAMFKFMIDNVKYPEEAYKANIQGKVVVRFAVGTDGTISDVSVEKSVDPALDAESIRVVKSMPKWNPGKENGKAVAMSMVIPITFSLK